MRIDFQAFAAGRIANGLKPTAKTLFILRGAAMKVRSTLLGALIVSAALVSASSYASATVVNFEGQPEFSLVSDGYGSITWNSNWVVWNDPGDPYNPASGFGRVYTNYDLHPAAILESVTFSFSTPTVFNGAWFSGQDVGNAGVTFELYNGVNLVATSGTLSQTNVSTFLASGYNGLVTDVAVRGLNGYYVMDDVTFAGAVPEPATWAMMMLGFAGLGFMGWRAKRKVAVAAA